MKKTIRGMVTELANNEEAQDILDSLFTIDTSKTNFEQYFFVTFAKLWHILRLSNISMDLCGYISDRKGKPNYMIFRNFAV